MLTIIDIPEELKNQIQFVAEYIGDQTDSWIRIKKEITSNSLPLYRKLFSRRHECTKKQILNDFDKLIMLYWKELTGIEPILYSEDTHPENWVQKKKGHALFLINKQKSENKKNMEKNEIK